MGKIKDVGMIIIIVVIVYIMLLGFWPFFTGVVNDVHDQLEDRPGIENYTGAQGGVDMAPWIIFPMPAFGGLIAVVYVLKYKRRDE